MKKCGEDIFGRRIGHYKYQQKKIEKFDGF